MTDSPTARRDCFAQGALAAGAGSCDESGHAAAGSMLAALDSATAACDYDLVALGVAVDVVCAPPAVLCEESH